MSADSFKGLTNGMSVPRTLDGFEVTATVKRMLDQPMLWWQAVGLFVEHFANWERNWQDSIGNPAQEQKNVHALRSAAANVGAMALSREAAALEEQLLKSLSGEESSIPPLLRDRLRDSFRQTFGAAAEAWCGGSPDAGEA